MKKIFKQLFIMLCLLAAPLGMNAQTLVFHHVGGEKTTVTLPASITVTPSGDKFVIDTGSGNAVELSKDNVMFVSYCDAKGDVNGDQRVDVADISTLVGIVIGATSSTGNAPEGAVAVDLGLPSGTKWANMNVGAMKASDYGRYFAWGETVGYSSDTNDGHSFDWASYKWMTEGMSSEDGINKYQTNDNKAKLDPTDDAAHVNWGGNWYMPTIADIEELINNTTSEWTTLDDVNGRKFTSKTNGNSIFMPAAGIRSESDIIGLGVGGNVWSSSLYSSNSSSANILQFGSGNASKYVDVRNYGRSVRPVLRK